jgi:membrane protein required for colicin V production
MDFTLADGIVALILLVSGMLAWSRGFTREALAIGGWIFAGAAAIYLAPY